MTTPLIRSNNPAIRDQQWSRMACATLEFTHLRELSYGLTSFIKSSESLLSTLWNAQARPDTTELRTLGKSIRKAHRRLIDVNHELIALASELETLNTALSGDLD